MLKFFSCLILYLLLLYFVLCESKARMHPREECFIEGACTNSYLIEERSTANANACHDFCKAVPDCQWFTFHSNPSLCLALANCNEINTVNYTDVTSGQSSCDQFQCGIQGRCRGNLVHVESAYLQQGCLTLCQDWNNNSPPPGQSCEWFTYNEEDNGCYLFNDCPLIDEECLTCVSGQSKCGPSKVMTKLLVGSGMPIDRAGDHFEIIDLSQPQIPGNCSFSKFPHDVFGAVGVVIPPSAGGSQGSPLVCGGFSNDGYQPVFETSCHQLPPDSSQSNWSTTDGWDRTTETGDTGRLFAAATTILDNGLVNEYVWWVTGGITYGDRVLKTTEIRFLNGSWGAGPLMENPAYAHCILQVLRHKTVLIGGVVPNDGTFSNISNVMTSFDWNTKNWSREAPLQTGRYGHACGLLRDPEPGNGEFPSKIIVAGGLGVDSGPTGRKPLSSVEIYDSTTKTWTAGPELPHPLFGAVMVQYGLDEVLLVGGGNNEAVFDTIWTISSTNLVWRQLDQRLSVPRYSHVAFLVPDNVNNPPCHDLEDILDDSDLIEEFQLDDDLPETSETTPTTTL